MRGNLGVVSGLVGRPPWIWEGEVEETPEGGEEIGEWGGIGEGI